MPLPAPQSPRRCRVVFEDHALEAPRELFDVLAEFEHNRRNGTVELQIKSGGICSVKDGRVWK